MEQKDYVETLVVNGKLVPVGIDDYGQCYYFEYVGADGQIHEMGCGTYNENYKEEIEYFFETEEQRQNRLIRELLRNTNELNGEVDKLNKKVNKLTRKLYKK